MRSRSERHRVTGFLLLLPSLLTLLLVVVLPIGYVVYLSFHGSYYGSPTGFVGLRNYVRILSDPNFYGSLKATLVFTAGTVAGQFLLGLAFALIINRFTRFEGTLRLVVLIPYMVSEVAAGVTFRWMLNTEFGLVNYILMALGLARQPINFLGEPALAMASIVMANLWSSVPFATVILLAGLKSVPTTIYESARIDGAGGFAQFTRITLPLTRAQIFVVLLIQTMFSLRHFPLPYAMTGGGPGRTTKLLALLLQEKMTVLQLDYNSALSVIMMVLTLVVAGLSVRLIAAEKD
jgi:multiple sugar transport system permease protein